MGIKLKVAFRGAVWLTFRSVVSDFLRSDAPGRSYGLRAKIESKGQYFCCDGTWLRAPS